MRLPLFLIATAALAQEPAFEVAPEIRQGYVIHLAVTNLNASGGVSAKFLEKTVPLFPVGDRRLEGLMPVPVTQRIGRFPFTFLDAAGHELHRTTVRVLDGRYLKQNIRTTKKMRAAVTSDEERKRMAEFRAFLSPTRQWTEPLALPVPECTSSPFGVKRLHDGKFTGNFHAGLDFNSPPGREVKAVADGMVKVARMFPRQGGTVGVDHGQGLQTTNIHLSRIAATEEQPVKRGDVIGYVGSTGFSTGPHLHFSVNVFGVAVQPLQWLGDVKSCR